MSDLMLAERLQPSLLDRLTDEAPGNSEDATSDRVIDVARLRKIIHRDLAWLLNSSNLEAIHDLAFYPNVARSVLNYGIGDLSGSHNTNNRIADIQRTIRKAIETFEPRILPQTLNVSLRPDRGDRDAIISFDIRGELWAEPVPVDLYLRTALDVTSGDLSIKQV